MKKRISNFLDISNLIYSLRFGFRQKHSTARTLINLTESIRQTLDESSLGRGIFVNVLDLHTYIFKRHLILVITKS